jgi:LacI family transcriptional regulator
VAGEVARPTLADVAKRAGVSVSTASNALSGVRPVGQAALLRVRAAADELAYVPDRAARSLVSRRSESIGIIIPDVTNPFFAELGRNLERQLVKRGFAALIGDSDNDVAQQRDYLTAFESRRVDGLIVVPAIFDDLGELAENTRRTPTVLIDRTVRDWPGSSVTMDQVTGVRALIDHLIRLGHRGFAFVSGSISASTGLERLSVFSRLLAERELPDPVVIGAEFTLESGRRAIQGLFEQRRSDLTAICAADDLLAFAVLEGARTGGLRVPADVSLTGFDDIPYASFVHPALTTVRQPIAEMSAQAVDQLVRGLGGNGTSESIVLEPELVIRASTGQARTAPLASLEPGIGH